MAIGTMMSEPLPVELRTGSRARMVVAAVMRQGRQRRIPAVMVALRISGSDLLMPWRSPLIRWRMETYGVLDEQGRLLHAEELTFSRWLQLTTRHRGALGRFLRWAACL